MKIILKDFYKKIVLTFIICIILFTLCPMLLGISSNIVNKKLVELEEKTSAISSIQADFVQKKKLAMFTKEIIIKGKFFIAKPDLFSWHVYKPVRYGLVVKNKEISQWNADTDKIKAISMQDNQAFTAIFDQMNNWLSGNYKSLELDYGITIISESPLVLKFIPLKTASSFRFISDITVYFDTDLRCLKEIVIVEKNDDKTTLSFLNTVLNGKIPEGAWNAKF